MMPQLIETYQSNAGPCCTREQARELLEGLRAAYQSLSLPEKTMVKGLVAQLGRGYVFDDVT